MTQNSEDKVRDLAYHLWVEAGQPEGRALDFWLAAELHVSSMAAAVAAPAKPRAAKPKAAAKAAPSGDKPKAAPRSRAKAK